MKSLLELAQLEEHRQSLGTSEAVLQTIAERPGGPEAVETVGEGTFVYAGPGAPWNQAVNFGLHGPVPDETIDRFIEFFESRGAEPRIEVATLADEAFIRSLAKRGFVTTEFEHVWMRNIQDLSGIEDALDHPLPANLELQRVSPDDDDEIRLFAEISTSGFRSPDQPCEGIWLEGPRQTVRHPGGDAYIAHLDGTPVGAGAMESRTPVACLFGASVLPAYRNRGTQTALIIRRLEQGRDRGCDVAGIHARPGIPTERNARRLGFFLAYAKVVMVRPGEGLTPTVC